MNGSGRQAGSIEEMMVRAAELHAARQFDQAISLYDTVLAIKPDHLDALSFLASAYRSTNRLDEAIGIYDRLEPLANGRSDFWFNRGNAANDLGKSDVAVGYYRRSIAIDPRNASALANLAIALINTGEDEAGLTAYRRALAIDPDHKVALHNLGNQLGERGQCAEAAELLRRTVRNWPDMPEGHYNLGLVLLRMGDFAGGFREYEWRWDTSDFFAKPGYRNMPVWSGEPLQSKRLLVHAEQGLGDAIQFSKLLGLVRSLGGDTIFHVPQKLERLLKTLPFDIAVKGSHGASDADYQIPLMSLPYRLKLTLGGLPQMSSHLRADPDLVSAWRSRLQIDGTMKTVGLVWQGNPNSPAERGRSLPSPAMLAPFAELQNVRLIALQKLDRSALEQADTPTGWRVRDLPFTLEHPGPDMDDGPDAFVDTAAIMSSLDLMVSVCTAPLHLAGALGRPTIALLRTVPDWRWLLEREDTPWYPTMVLCRQQAGETYAPAIERAAALAAKRLGVRPSNG